MTGNCVHLDLNGAEASSTQTKRGPLVTTVPQVSEKVKTSVSVESPFQDMNGRGPLRFCRWVNSPVSAHDGLSLASNVTR